MLLLTCGLHDCQHLRLVQRDRHHALNRHHIRLGQTPLFLRSADLGAIVVPVRSADRTDSRLHDGGPIEHVLEHEHAYYLPLVSSHLGYYTLTPLCIFQHIWAGHTSPP